MNPPISDSALTDPIPFYTSLPTLSQQQIPPTARISKPRSPSRKMTQPKVFVCSSPDCGKKFSKKWNLQAHERLHTGSTPFVCRLGCGEAYMWMSSRKGHETNRCKYALKKKNNRRYSRSSKAQATPIQETDNNNMNAPLTGICNSYSPLSPSLNRISITAHNKDLDFPSSLVVLDEASDCLSNVTEDVLEMEDIPKQETPMMLDADFVLADISLPETDIFTDDFLDLWTRSGPAETPCV